MEKKNKKIISVAIIFSSVLIILKKLTYKEPPKKYKDMSEDIEELELLGNK